MAKTAKETDLHIIKQKMAVILFEAFEKYRTSSETEGALCFVLTRTADALCGGKEERDAFLAMVDDPIYNIKF